MKTALLISHSKDFFTIDRVAIALQKANVRTIRFNTDLFPEAIKISEQVNGSGSTVIVHTEQEQFDIREIDVVWYRKIWQPILNTSMEEQYLKASIKESIAVRNSFFQSLQNLPWLDPIPAVVKASDKFYQLRTAQAVGLSIPQTIISNDAAAVKSFYKNLEGEMICKLHTALSTSMKGSDFSFYTTLIKEDDLDDLDMLETCPMIFQEYIPKAFELRIAYVDGQCFAGKIQSGDVVDWRKPGLDFSWGHFEVDKEIQKKLIRLMNALGLSFGAIDLIVHPDGSYVFLEVNPVGEWGMIERDLNLPISQAIATGLINRITQHETKSFNHYT